ncbi:MAG TPA: hypothetical protein VJ986_03640 [Gaiellaceae bacterium]|nr:hypothetical protein [Gaiellaceae bacterium]
MSADVAHELKREKTKDAAAARDHALRARIVLALGPATAAGGVLWAIAQPWRLTLLHPFGQGFWWLVSEPPLYVVLVGLLFRWLVAPGLVEDMEAAGEGMETHGAAPDLRGRGLRRRASAPRGPATPARAIRKPESEAGRSGERQSGDT